MSEPHVIASLAKNKRETLRIALDRYQGADLIDIRVCLDLGEHVGVASPTKKGVSLRVALLPELIEALQEAEAEARRRGLLP